MEKPHCRPSRRRRRQPEHPAVRTLTRTDKGDHVSADGDTSPADEWDPETVKSVITRLRPILKTWFRSEVRGLDLMPPGGTLLVSNHSGGLYAVDVPVFAVDFYDKFGYDRPVFTLSNDIMFRGPAAGPLTRVGFIPASRANAAAALRSGGIVVVFPGAATSTRIGPRRQRTRFISPAARGTSERQSRRAFRSFRWSRSGRRRTRYS